MILCALALRQNGTRRRAATITRKRTVFHGRLGYAAELGLLDANAMDRRDHLAQRTRPAATPAGVQATLARVISIRPELTAFFGCL